MNTYFYLFSQNEANTLLNDTMNILKATKCIGIVQWCERCSLPVFDWFVNVADFFLTFTLKVCNIVPFRLVAVHE